MVYLSQIILFLMFLGDSNEIGESILGGVFLNFVLFSWEVSSESLTKDQHLELCQYMCQDITVWNQHFSSNSSKIKLSELTDLFLMHY